MQGLGAGAFRIGWSESRVNGLVRCLAPVRTLRGALARAADQDPVGWSEFRPFSVGRPGESHGC